MMNKRTKIAVGLTLSILVGCAGLIDVPDITYDPKAPQGNPDGSTATPGQDGSVSGNTDGSITKPPIDGGDPTAPCDESKLQTDSNHCGRCNHGCLGGKCTAGKCEAVTIASGLETPTNLALDAENVYVTVSGGGGKVYRIKKDGSKTDALVTGMIKANGVQVNGTKLYWSSADFKFQDSGSGLDNFGGFWSCTLPGCADKTFLGPGDYACNVQLFNDQLYAAANNDSSLIRLKPDGTERLEYPVGNKPFSLVVDAQHIYYQAGFNFSRKPIAGGATENIDATDAPEGIQSGYIALDADRVYWAWSESPGFKGHVKSIRKDRTGAIVEYGTANLFSSGVAVDSTNVYWTDMGLPPDYINFNPNGSVRTCAKTGCVGEPTIMQDGLTGPVVITVDGDALYFVELGTGPSSATGTLRRIAKP